MKPSPHVRTRRNPAACARLGALIGLALFEPGTSPAQAIHPTHWAFQPLTRPAVPASAFSNAIDAFVSTATRGQAPGAEADRRTLIRRLSFDLRGLPPSPEEVEEFLKDTRPAAFERLVESFLSSPRYGERWGRHWLDIVGYADSNGYFSADSDRPLAWRFRDYVIRSIHADKPLDRFIQEQIAGDELAGFIAGGDVTPDNQEALIATHFWRNPPDGTSESDGNPLEVKVDKYAVLEGGVQLFGSAFLGLTLQCARCHDHKFEPITQEEYYGLEAVLRPAFNPDRWLKPNERALDLGTREQRESHKRRVAQAERELKTLKESLEGLTAPFRKQTLDENLAPIEDPLRKAILKALDTKEKERTDVMKSLLKTNATLVDVAPELLQKKYPAFAAAAEPLRQAIQKSEAAKPAPLERIAATFEPTNPPPAHHLLVRGNHANEAKEVAPGPPRFLACAGDAAQGSSMPSSGRRLALARWVTSPDNPLVARVLVNRVWHHHFGRGLVATIDNLGQSGARPASPELLDWLTAEFLRSGWSLKHLHRLIVNSATWRRSVTGKSVISRSVISNSVSSKSAKSGGSAQTNALITDLLITDLLTPRRLDAESLRDAMLAVSGELDPKEGGPYVPTKIDRHGQVIIDEKQAGAWRRSIYLQQRRTQPVEFLSTFDGPAHNPVCVQRVSSTVALQSLSLLNSDFVRLRARALALRLLGQTNSSPAAAAGVGPADDAARPTIERAFTLAYSRPPTEIERGAALEFLREQRASYEGQTNAALRVWTDLCQMLLASNAFLYVD